jgi:hypothetical protein
MPIHDEQGTRDRPFDLFCVFNRTGVDALLASLHEKPWTAPRPRLAVFLGVHHGPQTYVLARDGAQGQDQRASLRQEAEKRGMPVVLPDAAQIAALHLSASGLARSGPRHPEAAAKAAGGDLALSGSLIWSDKILGWVCRWRLYGPRRSWTWRVRGVSFDEAFRSGVGGAELILSGHPPPR